MEITAEMIAAKKLVEWPILALPGVVGVGIGMLEENGVLHDEVAIRVYVTDISQVPQIPFHILELMGGLRVCFIESHVEPLVLPDNNRYNPIVGGIKIINPKIGEYGTLGAVVQDSNTGELLGLSCFHVVGNLNSSFPFTVWQPDHPPGVFIPGTTAIPPDDNIGRVVRVDFPQTPPLPFSPILVGLVDAAVFTLVPALEYGRTLSSEIVDQDPPAILIDRITATAWCKKGEGVCKRGFRTRLTKGFVIDVNCAHQWMAGPSNRYVIDQALVMGYPDSNNGFFCDHGDSGSVVLRDSDRTTAVGLLWGGDRGGASGFRVGIISSIQNVESQLSVKMVWI